MAGLVPAIHVFSCSGAKNVDARNKSDGVDAPSGGGPQSADYDGTVVSANLGIDGKLGADTLAGVAVGQARGSVDYTGSEAVAGELTTSVTSITPYVGWQMAGGIGVWAMAGYGTGEVEIADESADAQASDLTQQMFAAGASGPLMSSDELISGGTTSLNLKGEAAFTSADIDGSGSLESMSLSADRQRLVLEGVYDQRLASGATFSPSLEIGFRNDGGDGETGTGIEAGGGLHYSDPASGMTLSARVRTLLSHGGDSEELGVSGLIRVGPGASAKASRSACSRRGARRRAAGKVCGTTASPDLRPTIRRGASTRASPTASAPRGAAEAC